MNTVQALVGNESRIISHYGFPPVTGNNHYTGECPVCGKKKKFRLYDYNNTVRYICVCGHGNLIELVMQSRNMDFASAAREIDGILGVRTRNENVVRIDDSIVTRFKNASPIRGSQVQEYLNARGIYTLPTRGVRYSVSLDDPQGMLQGMVAIAVDEGLNPCYEHRTYLHNGAKANVETQKKMRTIRPASGSCAIRLFDVDQVMGVAEGIETALSVNELYQIPTWSTMNSTIMKKFKAPVGVKELHVFADNDRNGTGMAAAMECANRNLLSGNDVERVIVRWPDSHGDFNDVLCSDMQVGQWEFTK